MDYLTLNALAITVVAAFGLWAFQHAAKKQKERDADKNRKDKEK